MNNDCICDPHGTVTNPRCMQHGIPGLMGMPKEDDLEKQLKEDYDFYGRSIYEVIGTAKKRIDPRNIVIRTHNKNNWPIFKCKRSSGGRIAINPNLVSAVYESTSQNVTEVYTLDCTKDDDAWDLEDDFDIVVERLSNWRRGK